VRRFPFEDPVIYGIPKESGLRVVCVREGGGRSAVFLSYPKTDGVTVGPKKEPAVPHGTQGRYM